MVTVTQYITERTQYIAPDGTTKWRVSVADRVPSLNMPTGLVRSLDVAEADAPTYTPGVAVTVTFTPTPTITPAV